ncbi:hypothetical protein I6N90_09850 [Paenibacillus sp. GSMTC-2017]|uniref:hypothetical protein n=1 Tax=Paenibacillus sp. GSMTC-2017 TaxID=2794350 RepID=UPI0018D94D0C|nr:hypothetical protein [Paenibacillus sp. GSMTC-2017]MBH5318110.1 hypothetical protein [Paenibacillus sp. GSMTC-2017]
MNEINHRNDEQVKRTHKKDYEKTFPATNSGFPNQLDNVNEEVGADFAHGLPVPSPNSVRVDNRSYDVVEDVDVNTSSSTLGYVSLIFAIASWFIWPVLMGATAAVLGYLAYRQGSQGLGGWAITIGLIAVALNVIIVPLYYALT